MTLQEVKDRLISGEYVLTDLPGMCSHAFNLLYSDEKFHRLDYNEKYNSVIFLAFTPELLQIISMKDDFDFIITGLLYDDERKEIVFVEQANSAGNTTYKYRFELLRSLEEGDITYTVALDDDIATLKDALRAERGVTLLNKVHLSKTEKGTYIRTDGAVVSADNLPGVRHF